ncbi:methyl-accepting chemotaxis protein [Natrialbaceae archaeon AArc-T1-2]|uniref:methyl-accepting chemotaxis protein n=1 Tax=Natrialbaceae archaeon AArc-T1-2 TaxID=3053904 RepID=UPI00255AC557|nr:methyl-accepting chemotaxis protein [Natrialbaceae archaeon AArc-T1-2]WIV67784.1 methyl-accepting chemotaxis protein [Natrialbaceae archaeon AArc-T1-2]
MGTAQLATEVEEQTHDYQTELAGTEAENVQNHHERNLLVTDIIAMSDPLEPSDDHDEYVEEARSFLETEQSRHADTTHIHLIDTSEEHVLASTADEIDDEQFGTLDATWTEPDQLPQRSDSYFIDVYENHDGDAVAAYARPVPDEDGVQLMSDRLVVYTVDFDAYAEHLTDEDGEIAYLVDTADERVLMDPTGTSTFESYEHSEVVRDGAGVDTVEIGTPDGSLADSIRWANEGDRYEDGEYLASHAIVPGVDNWYVVVHTPQDEAYGLIYTVREWGMYGSVAGLLLVVLVGGIIGRNTSKSINRLRSRAERMADGDLNVELETNRIDSIGQLYDDFATMRDSLREQIHEAQQARQEAEQAREETERVNRQLEAKADEYSEVMQTCADGDFTARMSPDADNEAMADIAEEFNEMVAEIEETTERIKAFAREVATASEQVTASSEEVRSASEQVTESVQEISAGADEQNEHLQSVTHEMNGLSTTIQQIAASSNEVAEIAAKTADAGDQGREAAQDAIEGMREIETESDAAVEEFERLEAEIEQIDDLLEFITEVAEQTNMLALNANIEAARSGGSDEGFSVVAGEVKELAEETKAAAEDIDDRLARIQRQSERTASEIRATSEHVSEHATSVERAVDALEDIAKYAAETNTGVQEISAASEQQAASTQQVVAMVDEAATIAEETTAESETVAAAAEEQTTALTDVSQSADELADRAVRLSEALDRFETDVDVDRTADELDIDATTDGLDLTAQPFAANGPDERVTVSEDEDEDAQTAVDRTTPGDDEEPASALDRLEQIQTDEQVLDVETDAEPMPDTGIGERDSPDDAGVELDGESMGNDEGESPAEVDSSDDRTGPTELDAGTETEDEPTPEENDDEDDVFAFEDT